MIRYFTIKIVSHTSYRSHMWMCAYVYNHLIFKFFLVMITVVFEAQKVIERIPYAALSNRKVSAQMRLCLWNETDFFQMWKIKWSVKLLVSKSIFFFFQQKSLLENAGVWAPYNKMEAHKYILQKSGVERSITPNRKITNSGRNAVFKS